MKAVCVILSALIALSGLTNAFTIQAGNNVKTFVLSSRVFMSNDDDLTRDPMPTIPTIERGVSVDQDGKSNVWAIEPKMEVDTKSSEEKGASAIFAVGGFAVFAIVAGLILTNLPDPDQF